MGLATLAPSASAASAITRTYDQFSGDWNRIGGTYPGYAYSGEYVFCNFHPAGYPTATQPCSIYSDAFTITATDGAHAFARFEVDMSAYGTVVTFTGRNAAGNVVATTSCTSAWRRTRTAPSPTRAA